MILLIFQSKESIKVHMESTLFLFLFYIKLLHFTGSFIKVFTNQSLKLWQCYLFIYLMSLPKWHDAM